MSDRLEKLMNFNAFAEAKKITGKSPRNDNETKILGKKLLRENQKLKEAELIARNDTHHDVSFDEAHDVYREHGFKTIYEERFIANQERTKGRADTYKIMWRDGILIVCESYAGGDLQNSALMYYNWIANDKDRVVEFIDSGRLIRAENVDGIAGFHDIREGFVYNLSKLENNGKFLTEWIDDPLISLSNFSQCKNDKEDSKVNLSLLPVEVRASLKDRFDS